MLAKLGGIVRSSFLQHPFMAPKALQASIGMMLLLPSTQAIAGDLQPTGNTVISSVTIDPAASQCSLHVWSTTNLRSHIGGWTEALQGGALGTLLDGKRTNNKVAKPLMEEALGPQIQAESLNRLNIGQLFAMPNAALVYAGVIDRGTKWQGENKRIASNASPCYGEIIIKSIYFERSPIIPPRLILDVVYRDFRNATNVPVIYVGRSQARVNSYSAIVDGNREAAMSGLVDAYLVAFQIWMRGKTFSQH